MLTNKYIITVILFKIKKKNFNKQIDFSIFYKKQYLENIFASTITQISKRISSGLYSSIPFFRKSVRLT